MGIAANISDALGSASFIRKMFEAGARLKAEYGAESVCDFSLGNPSLPPPPAFKETLNRLAHEDFEGKHAYMPNAGYPDVREQIAAYISREWRYPLNKDDVLMTCGAAGAMNVILKSLLNPGDEIIVNAPCFMEYKFYAANHGGKLILIPPGKNLEPDLAAMEAAITPATAAVLINSPNNPSGKIYSRQTISRMAEMLEKKAGETGRTIYLINDAPYRKLVYTPEPLPSIFEHYKHSIVVTSYSKDLSIPGERIGWLAIHPRAEDAEKIRAAAVFCNRILGYVNAPALMQKVVAGLNDFSVDIEIYRKKRDFFCSGLKKIGYQVDPPQGTFYIFAPVPGGDDLQFCTLLQEHKILVVPGKGFGCPGYFRIAFCVDDKVISRSLPGFEAVFKQLA